VDPGAWIPHPHVARFGIVTLEASLTPNQGPSTLALAGLLTGWKVRFPSVPPKGFDRSLAMGTYGIELRHHHHRA